MFTVIITSDRKRRGVCSPIIVYRFQSFLSLLVKLTFSILFIVYRYIYLVFFLPIMVFIICRDIDVNKGKE